MLHLLDNIYVVNNDKIYYPIYWEFCVRYLLKEKAYANFGFYPKSFTKFILFASGRCWPGFFYNIAAL